MISYDKQIPIKLTKHEVNMILESLNGTVKLREDIANTYLSGEEFKDGRNLVNEIVKNYKGFIKRIETIFEEIL